VNSPDMVTTGDALELTFRGNRTLGVVVADGPAGAAAKPAPIKKPATPEQGSLF